MWSARQARCCAVKYAHGGRKGHRSDCGSSTDCRVDEPRVAKQLRPESRYQHRRAFTSRGPPPAPSNRWKRFGNYAEAATDTDSPLPDSVRDICTAKQSRRCPRISALRTRVVLIPGPVRPIFNIVSIRHLMEVKNAIAQKGSDESRGRNRNAE